MSNNHQDQDQDLIWCSSHEMRVIELLAALDSGLLSGQEALRERLSGIPGGWMRFRLIAKTLESLLVQIYETMPYKNLRHMQSITSDCVISIVPRVSQTTNRMCLVEARNLEELVDSVLVGDCAICGKHDKDAKACPVRKVLRQIYPPKDRSPYGDDCEYFWEGLAAYEYLHQHDEENEEHERERKADRAGRKQKHHPGTKKRAGQA